jgi:hypothetical protein
VKSSSDASTTAGVLTDGRGVGSDVGAVHAGRNSAATARGVSMVSARRMHPSMGVVVGDRLGRPAALDRPERVSLAHSHASPSPSPSPPFPVRLANQS